MKCILLVGGYARRMYPLTENVPKPLLKVNDKTVLDIILDIIDGSTNEIDEYILIDRFKYGRNLLIFACISEIPWNFAQNGTLLFADKQNVFFTLFLGYLAFCLIDRFKENPTMQLVSMLALLAVSYFLKADYGYKGYVFLLIMFWLHQYKPAQALIGSCWLIYEWKACFAFISLNMYNGRRGFIRGKWAEIFLLCILPCSYCNINNHTQKVVRNLTESSKSPAGVAKSNKQWVGTCLYQEECSSF